MSWLPNRKSCQVWHDAKLVSLPSWALVGNDRRLAGFEQCYLRAGRCHLGRLAIAPAFREQGFASTLVREHCG